MKHTYATDGVCHNCQPGTFNHECGRLAEFVGSRPDGSECGFCGACREHGHEARQYTSWRPLRRAQALALRFQRADDDWSAELAKHFGARAGDVRYTPEGNGAPGSYLRFLSNRFDVARDAWQASLTEA